MPLKPVKRPLCPIPLRYEEPTDSAEAHTETNHAYRKTAAPRTALALSIATVEALVGRRPLHQLRKLLSPEAFYSLATALEADDYSKSFIRLCRWQMPTEKAAEVIVRVSVANGWRACAIRMELGDHWRCTHFTVLVP